MLDELTGKIPVFGCPTSLSSAMQLILRIFCNVYFSFFVKLDTYNDSFTVPKEKDTIHLHIYTYVEREIFYFLLFLYFIIMHILYFILSLKKSIALIIAKWKLGV